MVNQKDSGAPGPPSHQEYEKVIQQVRGVIDSRVVLDAEGMPEEVHVLAEPGRNPKQVVRDIESAVLVHLGVSVDHKKISVVQVRPEEGRPVASPRPAIRSFSFWASGLEAEATVEIEIGGVVYSGAARGMYAEHEQLRLVCRAALQALEGYFRGTVRFALCDVVKISISGRYAMVAGVAAVSARVEEFLLGAALIRREEKESAVQAVIRAVEELFFRSAVVPPEGAT